MAHGNWVEGDRFWGRETDLSLFISRIDDGAQQQLTAQRRMGKTSLMRETARRLEDRYHCIFVDLQKSSAAPDALVALSLAIHPHQSLWKKLGDIFAHTANAFRENIKKINLGEVGISLRAGLAGDWQQKGDLLMAALADANRPVLLLIDEAPILINRILKGADYCITPERRAEADLFLSWIRDNSLRYQGRIRFVLSGSIGLEPILRQARLSVTLNHFISFELKPWDAETACGCLNALATEYGVTFEKDVVEEMVAKLGYCIPHHVQMFFRHAHNLGIRRGDTNLSKADVERVYAEEMLSIRGHTELTHDEERLDMVLGREIFPLALELLTETAVTGHLTGDALHKISDNYTFESLAIAEAQKQTLEVLEHDGYIERRSDHFRFVSKLLQDWWTARHGFGYIPTSKRGV